MPAHKANNILRTSVTLLSAALCILALGTSCDDDVVTPPLAVCVPVLDSLEPDEGPLGGGTDVTLHGLFIATEQGVRDTRIQVSGIEATVTDVSRDAGCLACDQCILAALRCIECERVCRGENGWSDEDTGVWLLPEACTEQVVFTTPEGDDPGPAAIILTTSRGSGVGLDFTYLAGDDDDSAGDDDDSAGDDDDATGDDDDATGDDDTAGDDDTTVPPPGESPTPECGCSTASSPSSSLCLLLLPLMGMVRRRRQLLRGSRAE